MSTLVVLPIEEVANLLDQVVRRALSSHFIPAEPEAERYVQKAEAADFLSISESTLNRYIADGEIAFIKKSRRVYFKVSDLRAFLEVGRRRSRTEIVAELTPKHLRR